MTDYNPVPLTELAEHFAKLPGIGMKSAQRLAYHVLSMSESEVKAFANAMLNARKQVGRCSVCSNLTELEVCPICDSAKRDHSVICVVETPKDVDAFERTNEYKGVYHVLHGLISPINGIGPDQITIKELLKRLDGNVSEIIMATNPTVEGEATAMYISKLIKPFGVKVTRLAFGLPIGASLEFADEVTLFKALENRNEI
ncbi:MAG: recombination mediator RecR [Oscillospiraceae bacterium]